MHFRVQLVSIAFAVVVFVAVFELVRRRHLRERYALVWMAAALVLLVLAVWKDLLNTLSKAVGIYYPPNALFVIAFGFLLLVLLHLSAAVSRLSDQTRVLAQRLSLLEQRRRLAETSSNGEALRGHADDQHVTDEEFAPHGMEP
ncbi:MAG: DUF2304 domain-containing protein [Solirubrobacteraceae bacterium]